MYFGAAIEINFIKIVIMNYQYILFRELIMNLKNIPIVALLFVVGLINADVPTKDVELTEEEAYLKITALREALQSNPTYQEWQQANQDSTAAFFDCIFARARCEQEKNCSESVEFKRIFRDANKKAINFARLEEDMRKIDEYIAIKELMKKCQ